ncbi:hypothetical protein [Cohaesibacter marisflavi]|uniref:hypothetical protein n=1 Tax=Cohaesibacter marisflavi TaxID=655353 RepID=UPI0029C659F6|nr:hypothetical protein [Cohaesibacter marisflavi]
MKTRPSGAGSFRPPIEVRPWADPVSGNRLFIVNGPMQVANPGTRMLSLGEMQDLRDKVDAVLAKEAGQ